VSATTGAAPLAPPTTAARAPRVDACPLCGSPLDAAQDWCLRCGAAARTRLAAAARWRAVVIAFAIFALLALGAIAAALVKIAGETTTPPAVTRTVITTVAPAPAAPPSGAPATAPRR
jgi:hypothetical protein